MAPGDEMFRYPQHFGENVLPRGSHEWLPYSVDAVRAEIVKHQFVALPSFPFSCQKSPAEKPTGLFAVFIHVLQTGMPGQSRGGISPPF